MPGLTGYVAIRVKTWSTLVLFRDYLLTLHENGSGFQAHFRDGVRGSPGTRLSPALYATRLSRMVIFRAGSVHASMRLLRQCIKS